MTLNCFHVPSMPERRSRRRAARGDVGVIRSNLDWWRHVTVIRRHQSPIIWLRWCWPLDCWTIYLSTGNRWGWIYLQYYNIGVRSWQAAVAGGRLYQTASANTRERLLWAEWCLIAVYSVTLSGKTGSIVKTTLGINTFQEIDIFNDLEL